MNKVLKNCVVGLLTVSAALTLTGCGSKPAEEETAGKTVVKVGVVGEYNDAFDTIGELVADQGIEIELVKYADYAMPNRALSDGDIDLNAFQHKAFLRNEVDTVGYDLTPIADTLIAPLAIFNNKDKISSVEEIKDGDVIAIPSDLTNGGRALKLLEAAGLITCDPAKGQVPTKADITAYHVNIELMEAESATLANLLPDCTAAIINGGNAFTAGLNPLEDAIFLEDVNPETNPAVADLVNVLVCRTEDQDNPVYRAIADAYHTEEVRNTIDSKYQGAFICAW